MTDCTHCRVQSTCCKVGGISLGVGTLDMVVYFLHILYLSPIHCAIKEMPLFEVAKGRVPCHTFEVVVNLIASSIYCPHQQNIKRFDVLLMPVHWLTKWALKMPLWCWWWISDMKHWNMLACGRLAQNGFTGCNPCLTNAFGFRPFAHCFSVSNISLWSHKADYTDESHSLCFTKHHGHQLSRQQVTRHCSRKSVTYICCKDGMHSAYPSIGTDHFQPFLTHNL